MWILNPTGRRLALLLAAVAPLLAAWIRASDPAPVQDDPMDTLRGVLGAEGIELDREAGAVSLPVQMLVTRELLEYVLVGPSGSAHESLLVTEAKPSLINAAILAAGVEPGQNAFWQPVEPFPTDEEIQNGAAHHELVLPSGDGVLPYLAWREGDEVYLVRVEDAICDLAVGRSMRRHRWVYIGSRFATLRKGGPEVYLADEEQNLINLTFFTEGNTLVTASLPECQTQTIWRANDWILPPRGESVRLILAHKPLDRVPESFLASLPEPSREVPER
jgi:hypothetical protein